MGKQEKRVYKDISFGLYASADLTALDGSVIPAGGLLEVVSVDPNEAGSYDASFASDLPFGSYYVKERTTNSAYILSDTEYPVVFEYAGQEVALVQILVNEGEAVSNDLLRGRVDGVKVGENPEGGEDVKLSGALMGLFRPDTEEFTEENALLTVTTVEDGSFSFENIPYGHWIVKEISSPALYTVSPEQHHIYIGVDDQRIEIKVENTLIRGSVQVMKTEAVDEPSSVEKEDKDNNTLKRSIDRDLIVTSQREALQTLRCIISNLEYRFYKAYGMEIEDKRTVYGECTYRLVPREDEPSVCLMHDWIYLPSA